MSQTAEKQLITTIRIAPAALMLLFVVILIALIFQISAQQTRSQLNSLREEFLSQQQELLKAQVVQVKQQIDFERQQTESRLKQSIQHRIYEAHRIAENIYAAHPGKTEAEITKLITGALRTIRFNEGRGYFFIYKTTGETVMHPILPQNEGVNKIDLQDVRGAYIVRDMGQLVKEQGEAFYRWWFVKPQIKDTEFEKIGFGKYFEPYDWFIGTGEYIVDVEADIQKRVLNNIQNIRFGKTGFMFVYGEDGTTLVHRNEDWIGKNRRNAVDENGKAYIQKMLTSSQSSSGYISYISPYNPNTKAPGEKLAYVDKTPYWNWVIGTGVYVSEIESAISVRQTQLEDEQRRALYQLLILCIISTLILAIVSWLLSRRIASRFATFQAKINNDFDRLERTKDQMEFMALHDSLTGLPNRTKLQITIGKDIELSKSNNNKLALMFVDLDDFKKINDAYGHNSGDKLLQKLSVKFNELTGELASVSRFGGDEFIFSFPNMRTIHDIERKVEEINNLFSNEFVIDGHVMKIGCSIGISVFPDDGDNPEDLITKADIVLYKSKSKEKGRALFYDNAINQKLQHEFQLEKLLRNAVSRDEIYVRYQPQIDSKTGDLAGLEVLARWNNDELGEVSPYEFVPIAEDIGAIYEISWFVINKACEDFIKIQATLGQHLHLSINISPKLLLQNGFDKQIYSAIVAQGVKPEQITLEITENVLIDDLQFVKPVLEVLRDYGFGISLDDFGTGYSSLSYINNLPLTEIKIDRSFVDNLLTQAHSETLVIAILAIGQASQLQVVAEGVETIEQANRLRELECDWLQGYYFNKPITVNELIDHYRQ